MRISILILLVPLSFIFAFPAYSQVKVSGTVFEMNRTFPLPNVSVLSTKGRGTQTDSSGHYTIIVSAEDSIYFSYLGRPTPKYAVSTIPSFQQFDVSLHINVTTLREVRVMPKNRKLDSIQNRQDYAKAFDFRKPGLGLSSTNPNSGDFGVGLDLDQLINVFRFRRNRSMAAFQQRLELEEKDKYVEFRFSRSKIRKVTGLTGPDIDTFIRYYSPPYEFVTIASEYELLEYMKKSGEQYKRLKAIGGKMYGRKPDEE
jgi:hypothetical protein